jgi:hypothetical protein
MAGRDHEGAGKAKPPQVSIGKLPSLGGETEIFGRRAETAWLDACWTDGAHVASVVAPGGVGKSALVWDWLRTMQCDGWRGAERVYGWSFSSQGTTDQMTSADQFVSATLRWLGDPAPDTGSPLDKGERLAQLAKERRTLLVLDGVEPLQWGPGPEEGKIKDPALATLVRELGAQNDGLCVISSRLPVRDVADFASEKCRRLDLTTLTKEAGAALLRARGVKGTEEELRKTVREYGGHSLALALLGSYLEEAAEGDVRRRKDIGDFHEGMSLAALWKLPVVFVCENNEYAMGTPLSRTMSVEDVSMKGLGYGMARDRFVADHVLTVKERLGEAIERARKQSEPTLVEVRTYRFR